MSGSDNYIFAKSLAPQGIEQETPFESENWNFIPDLNSGIYGGSGGGLSLVQFDLSSVYSSSACIDVTQAYLAIPTTLVTQGQTSASLPVFSSTTAAVAGSTYGMWQWAGLKAGGLNLLHAAEFACNGQQIEQYQPYNNLHSYSKWLSMASQDDQNVFCPSLGFGRTALDNPLSLKYNGPASTVTAGITFASFTNTQQVGVFGGNGLTNCAPYATGGSSIAGSLPNSGDQSNSGVQNNASLYNNNYYYRLNDVIDTTAFNNLTGSSSVAGDLYGVNGIQTPTQIATEFRSNFSIQTTATNSFGVTQQVIIIRLCDILDSCKNMPLTKRLSGTLRLYFNTGSCWINGIGTSAGSVQGTAGVGGGGGLFSGSSTNFTNTCPVMISQLTNISPNVNSQPYTGATALNGATPAFVQSIGASLTIGKATGANIGPFTFPALASNLIPSCRLYYPQTKLKPEKMRMYLDMGLNKKVCYAPYLFSSYQNIGAGSSFSQLVQSGIKRPRGIMLLPFVSASVHGNITAISGIVPFSPLLSPFADISTSPISIVNLQVSLGGQNQIQNIVQYSWEQFLNYTSNYNKLNGVDLGIKCGIYNQFTFENYFRMYYIDLSRSTLAEAMTTRNLTLSFLNNSNVAIDTYIFCEYFDEFEINVENGIITKN